MRLLEPPPEHDAENSDKNITDRATLCNHRQQLLLPEIAPPPDPRGGRTPRLLEEQPAERQAERSEKIMTVISGGSGDGLFVGKNERSSGGPTSSLPAAASSGGNGGRAEDFFPRGVGARASGEEGGGQGAGPRSGSGLGWVEKGEGGGAWGRGQEKPGARLGRSGWNEEREGGGEGKEGQGGGKGEELLAAAEAVWRISEMAREVLEGELERRGAALAAAESANREAGEAACRQVRVQSGSFLVRCNNHFYIVINSVLCWCAVCSGVQCAVWCCSLGERGISMQDGFCVQFCGGLMCSVQYCCGLLACSMVAGRCAMCSPAVVNSRQGLTVDLPEVATYVGTLIG